MFNHSVARFRTPFDYVDRKWARIHLSFEALISSKDAEAGMPVRIINFSEGGFLIEAPDTVRPGEIVELDLTGLGKVQARIAWSHAGRAGGAFVSPIPANDLVESIEMELGL